MKPDDLQNVLKSYYAPVNDAVGYWDKVIGAQLASEEENAAVARAAERRRTDAHRRRPAQEAEEAPEQEAG